MTVTLAAVDLGATSGRVIAATYGDGRFDLTQTARFPNGPVAVPTERGQRLHWDVLRLWESVREGLLDAAHDVGPLHAVGIDTWGVDYGLLDEDGALTAPPASYRCLRTDGMSQRLFDRVPASDVYAATGIQVQPFNTLFQLLAEPTSVLSRTRQGLLLPDLLGYWLTGRAVAEVTNASTTGMLDPARRDWARPLLDRVGSAFGRDLAGLLPNVVEPGTVLGPIRPQVAALTSADGTPTPLVAVGSHDTASAVAAVPAHGPGFAYISCGTWSLVGLELEAPVLTEDSRLANFTNELGIDGTVRYLRNVMGLWILSEAVAGWRAERRDVDVASLARQAESAQPLRTVIDVDDPAFLPPGPMADRVAELARSTGQPVPRDPVETTRCILDSLALAYRRAVRQAAQLSGEDVEVVHVVGGGINNRLLMQLTADATGLPVIAGPGEGTALGNLAVQARAIGALPGDRYDLRAAVRASTRQETYQPGVPAPSWDAAERRLPSSD